MRILIADDDAVSRRLLQGTLVNWGYEVLVASDGNMAWKILQEESSTPELTILDWMMPGKEGPEICQLVRQSPNVDTFLILLTSRDEEEDVVLGLDEGADDYIVKPFSPNKLHARIRSGLRIIQLQRSLTQRATELQTARDRVQLLQKLLPICCYCKKIRDDDNYWHQLESYLVEHTQARFSHGVCPDCLESRVKEELKSLPGASGEDPIEALMRKYSQ